MKSILNKIKNERNFNFIDDINLFFFNAIFDCIERMNH